MSGREFVPRPRRRRNLPALAAAWFLTSALWGVIPQRFEPRTYARSYEPGEIVRFEVQTDAAATSMQGKFLESALTFVAVLRDRGDRAWIAWAVVPLDAAAGRARYRVTVKRTDGTAQTIDGTITIVAKAFPEQRLTVASKFVNPAKSAAARIAREQKRLGAVYARRTESVPAAAPFVKPVEGDPTSEFGTRRFFNGEPRSPHPGIDLRATTGTPVLCAGPGRVALAADLYYSGGTIIVDHGGGLFTIYAHLSKIEAKDGTAVAAGDRLGLSGATGRVTGPHLHWGARVGTEIFDPRALLDPKVFGAVP